MVELFFKCIFTLAVLKPYIGRPPYYCSIFVFFVTCAILFCPVLLVCRRVRVALRSMQTQLIQLVHFIVEHVRGVEYSDSLVWSVECRV